MHVCTLAVCVLLVGFVAVDARRECTCNKQCDPGECCLSPVVRRGKRQTYGFCSPLTASGDTCYVNNNEERPVYYDGCPCGNGFTCEGSGNFVVPQGETGTCETEVRPCSTFEDCQKGECCVSRVRPIGKKKRQLVSGQPGTCQRLGQEGDGCLENQSTVQDINFVCPCASGFSCQVTGFDIPLGPSGFCTAR